MATFTASDGFYEITDSGYGKSGVKILHLKRSGKKHEIKEFDVSTKLRLNNHRDYKYADNSDIVATDSQKNTVYLVAKKYGVKTPEEFAMALCEHFLKTYSHVEEVNVVVEEYPWERIKSYDKEHNHAFVFTPVARRTAKANQLRNGPCKLKTCLTDLRVLKTTQSSFENFVNDDYRTLPDAKDRLFSTIVDSNWDYSSTVGVDFDAVWKIAIDTIFEKFAGCPVDGIASPSVQNTLYLTEKSILDKVPKIEKIEITMPNKHYFNVDFGKFPDHLTRGDLNCDVLQPVDKPSGSIRAVLSRKNMIKSKL